MRFVASWWHVNAIELTVSPSQQPIHIRGKIMHRSFKFSNIFCVFAATVLVSTSSLAQNFDSNSVASVTIKAKRLSTQEKTTYDQEQANKRVQQIVISAKRLSAADKLAYDKTQAQ